VALLAQRYELEYIDGPDASALTRVIRHRAGVAGITAGRMTRDAVAVRPCRGC